MKVLLMLMILTNFVRAEEHIPFRDSCSIVRAWQAPAEVPLPTLDHHLGKVTASIAVYSVLSLSGVNRTTSFLITSAAALTFEIIQVSFFNETVRHATNDVVLFSFHVPVHLAMDRNYIGAVGVTLNLSGLYLLLLPCQ